MENMRKDKGKKRQEATCSTLVLTFDSVDSHAIDDVARQAEWNLLGNVECPTLRDSDELDVQWDVQLETTALHDRTDN